MARSPCRSKPRSRPASGAFWRANPSWKPALDTTDLVACALHIAVESFILSAFLSLCGIARALSHGSQRYSPLFVVAAVFLVFLLIQVVVAVAIREVEQLPAVDPRL